MMSSNATLLSAALKRQLRKIGIGDSYLLMQHHNGPTRLLDWSDSAVMALHLALRDKGALSGASGDNRGLSARRFENLLVSGSRPLLAALGPPSRCAVHLWGKRERGEIPLNYFSAERGKVEE
jgi:FRG domain